MKYNLDNILLDTDSYKCPMFLQYPKNTTNMFNYLESRGGLFNKTVFFGLQYIMKEYLTKRITEENVIEAREFYAAHGVEFNSDGFMALAQHPILQGKLPIQIKAVPEGTVVPVKNCLLTAESTYPEFFWAVSYFEDVIMRLWYPITVATTSWHCRRIIENYLEQTADAPDAEIAFKLHDFGSRGVSSRESAGIGGAAHLVNFQGSDTIMGVTFANHYYNHDMSGFSINASEHSTMTIRGKDGELEACRNMIEQFAKPDKIFAIVGDSYDLWNFIDNYIGTVLKDKIISSGATLVVRPDSGNPVEIVTETVKRLADKFGIHYNSKGYKVLNYVKVIQGDGVNLDSIRAILNSLEQEGFSTSNIAFGMGRALLQKVDRDTQKFAYKCSSAVVDGKKVDVYKEPITDPGKNSKRGRLDLIYTNNKFETVKENDPKGFGSVLRTVFRDGKILIEDDLETIRKRAN